MLYFNNALKIKTVSILNGVKILKMAHCISVNVNLIYSLFTDCGVKSQSSVNHVCHVLQGAVLVVWLVI